MTLKELDRANDMRLARFEVKLKTGGRLRGSLWWREGVEDPGRRKAMDHPVGKHGQTGQAGQFLAVLPAGTLERQSKKWVFLE